MSDEVILRPATRADVPVLFDLIEALAEYEKLSHAVTGNAVDLENHLFGDRPFAEAILAECEDRIVGWALFFYNYSTFLTQIVYLARLTVERGCGRLEWSVLDWNELAIGFYKGIGADVMPDWRICRVAGESLASLASK
ncbi:MAG: GNAT family N-acetyltransferase [Oscillatoriales cyanobacterium]|nr:MAG: GNAT family N-acetyltransferase [Oscillatoriales cyanobacterium]